jgi:hypothetical protein
MALAISSGLPSRPSGSDSFRQAFGSNTKCDLFRIVLSLCNTHGYRGIVADQASRDLRWFVFRFQYTGCELSVLTGAETSGNSPGVSASIK